MAIFKRFLPFIITGAITALTLCSFLLMPDLCDVYGMPLCVVISAVVFTIQLSCCFALKRLVHKLIPSFVCIGLAVIGLLAFLSGGTFLITVFPFCAIAAISDAVAWFLFCGIHADTE